MDENKVGNDNLEEKLGEEEQEKEVPILQNDEVSVIEKLKAEIDELNNRIIRNFADAENMRKRLERQIEEARNYSTIAIATDIVFIAENFFRALEHKPKDLDSHPEMKNILFGIEMTKNDLINVLNNHGIVRILPQSGEKFDYNFHQAVSQIETTELKPGMIINVIQAGYKIKDRLIRPAMVTVATNINFNENN